MAPRRSPTTRFACRDGSCEMPSSTSWAPAVTNRSENHFVRVRGVFGQSSHSDFLIHSLGIRERSQKSVNGHTLDIDEIVFFAEVDLDRFVFHIISGRTIFCSANSKAASRAASASIWFDYLRLFAFINYPQGKVFFTKNLDSLFPYGKV
jgi:hypothetical protein